MVILVMEQTERDDVCTHQAARRENLPANRRKPAGGRQNPPADAHDARASGHPAADGRHGQPDGFHAALLGEARAAGCSRSHPRRGRRIGATLLFARLRHLFISLELVFLDTTSIYFEGHGGATIGQYGHSKCLGSQFKWKKLWAFCLSLFLRQRHWFASF